jgi:hypothetical protein
VGAPTSAILAEVYIHSMKHKEVYQILIKYQIIGYFRYIDYVFIIYNHRKTNIDETFEEFNKQRTNKEQHYSNNFLDNTQ